MKKISFNTFLLILVWTLQPCYSVSFSDIIQESADTKKHLTWSQKALVQIKKDSSKALKILEHFAAIDKSLDRISHSESLKNKKFHADRQKIELNYKICINLYARILNKKNTLDIQTFLFLFNQLKSLKAEKEFFIDILLPAGQYDLYYQTLTSVLTTFDAHPERLHLKPTIPPVFEIRKNISINTLHNIIASYELSKKHYWTPAKSFEIKTLMAIAIEYEAHKLYSYALSTLELIQEDYKTPDIHKKISLLKSKSSQIEETEDELY